MGSGPLFILGAPRSGTSLLYKALAMHPRAAWISNWVRRAPAFPATAVLNRLAARAPRLRRTVWFGPDRTNAYVYGRSRPPWERLFPMPVEGEPVFARCGVPEGVPDPAQLDEGVVSSLREEFAAVRAHGGGTVMVNKRIANNLRVPLLHLAFPTARFVHLVRDGRGVAYSLSRVDWWPETRVWWYGGTPREWRDEGRDPWELCARHWVEEITQIRLGSVGLPDAQQLSVRYEDLVRRPSAVLEAIAGFGGLGPDRTWSEQLRMLRYPDRNESWRQHLAPEVADRIGAIQARELGRYGYVA